MPRASRLGEELKKQGVEVEYIAGSGGIFDVSLDGNILFSKKRSGGFPDTAEIIALINRP